MNFPANESVAESDSKMGSSPVAKPDAAEPRPEKAPTVKNGIPGNFWVEIRKFKIRHGTIYFLGASGGADRDTARSGRICAIAQG